MVAPFSRPVASPFTDMEAIEGSELVHFTREVMSSVVESERVPIALNESVSPTAKILGIAGVTAIDVNSGMTTFTVAGGLVTPKNEALISIFPVATAVTTPVAEIVAMAISELVQVTSKVMSLVESFEYVPIAVSCEVKPVAKSSGEAGIIATEDNDATVIIIVGLIIPFKSALISVVPLPMPVTKPDGEIVATSVSELAHIT